MCARIDGDLRAMHSSCESIESVRLQFFFRLHFVHYVGYCINSCGSAAYIEFNVTYEANIGTASKHDHDIWTCGASVHTEKIPLSIIITALCQHFISETWNFGHAHSIRKHTATSFIQWIFSLFIDCEHWSCMWFATSRWMDNILYAPHSHLFSIFITFIIQTLNCIFAICELV